MSHVMLQKSQEEIVKNWVKSDKPLVSVCCMTYNHERYIDHAIDSFLMQETTYPFEILVHDDASTDNTTNIILQYAEKYPKLIKLILQTKNQYQNGGLIYPRFVFPHARGKYIALCDGDDYWTDSAKLQKQVSFLENNPQYVITYTNSRPFNENGFFDHNFGGTLRDVTSNELKKGVLLYTSTTCFRNVIKDILSDLKSVRIGDKVIWSLLGAYGDGKYLSDIAPAAYRVHRNSILSMSSRRKKLEMSFTTSSALYSYYFRLGNSDIAQYYLEDSCIRSIKAVGLVRLIKLSAIYLLKKIRIIRS